MTQKHYTTKDLVAMEQRYRAAFVNSITGFKSLCLVGTRDAAGQTNLAVFSSLLHLGSNPALLGLIVRPNIVERHTLSNILETRAYSINHVSEHCYKKAHQTSARYPKNTSEFSASGLKEDYKQNFFTPFVEGSPLQIALKLEQQIPISSNGTILIIGKVEHVFLDAEAVHNDGFVDLEKLGSITVSGLDSYHSTKRLARLSYAKPNQEITEI
jgi:flavin reductase (DIM6/NTAB) family NADH-FMN oxidoreductase RutF